MMPPRSQFPNVPPYFDSEGGPTLGQKADEWRRHIRADPARVVAVLKVSPEQPRTPYGDDLLDTWPALLVVMEAARGNMTIGTPASKAWVGLVEAGIVPALCQAVIGAQAHPDTPQERKLVNSVFNGPLEAISNALTHLQFPPTNSDKQLVKETKEYWPRLMKRIWDDPGKTLVKDEEHVMERFCVAQIIRLVLEVDPTYLAILYEPEDLTIPLITRNWTHSTSINDTRLCAQTLTQIISPSNPLRLAYARGNSAPSPAALLERVYRGAGAFGSSDPATQAFSLMATFAAHIERLPVEHMQREIAFLWAVQDASKEAAKEGRPDEISRVLFSSSAFWDSAIGVLKRPLPQPGPSKEVPVDEPISAIVGTLADLLSAPQGESPQLIGILLGLGFFDAINNILATLLTYIGMPMQLNRIWMEMEKITREGSPELKKQLAAQLPRWRIIGELVKHDMRNQTQSSAAEQMMFALGAGGMPPRNSRVWNAACWQTFAELSRPYLDWGICQRRGCGKKGTAKCSMCKTAGYCGKACQKADWKEHKACCGWMPFLEKHMGRSVSQPT